jgi:hypothetical protein
LNGSVLLKSQGMNDRSMRSPASKAVIASMVCRTAAGGSPATAPSMRALCRACVRASLISGKWVAMIVSPFQVMPQAPMAVGNRVSCAVAALLLLRERSCRCGQVINFSQTRETAVRKKPRTTLPGRGAERSPRTRATLCGYFSVGMGDVARAKTFCDAALKPLGHGSGACA